MNGGWLLEEREGLLLIRCVALNGLGRLAHAFTTRRGPRGGDFDVGGADPDDLEAARARRRAASAAGLAGEPMLLRQVHGATMIPVTDTDGTQEADGSFWTGGTVGLFPAVRSADCVPLLMAHRYGKAAVAVHSGWRGVAVNIAGRAVRELRERGFQPGEWIAALGPAIGPCCYEVGDDVAAAVRAATGGGGDAAAIHRSAGGRPRLHLAGLVAGQLRAAGLPGESVHVSPWCTRCRADLFHSHRRDGADSGRMMAMVGPASAP